MEEQKPLTSVHEALNNATWASMSRPGEGEPISFRLSPDLKRAASGICQKHNTTVSEFLRQCVIGLVSDYNDPSRG
jgi:hypothetical protein